MSGSRGEGKSVCRAGLARTFCVPASPCKAQSSGLWGHRGAEVEWFCGGQGDYAVCLLSQKYYLLSPTLCNSSGSSGIWGASPQMITTISGCLFLSFQKPTRGGTHGRCPTLYPKHKLTHTPVLMCWTCPSQALHSSTYTGTLTPKKSFECLSQRTPKPYFYFISFK